LPPPSPLLKHRHCPHVVAVLSVRLEHHQCNGKKKVRSSESKEVLVDEEEALKVIENQKVIVMRAAEKIWPSSATIEDQLRELVSDGLI
jgi:hypothetical protein